MTNKEAVNWLINVMADIGKAEHSDLWHYEQALMEIREKLESQPEQRWIPCYPSELPKNMSLWATFDDGDGYRYVEKVFWDMTEWNRDVSNVVAYMEYEEPKPYGGKE